MTEHESRQRDGRGYFAEQGSVVKALRAIEDEPIYGVDTPLEDEDGAGHTGQEWAFLRWIDVTKEVARDAIPRAEALERDNAELANRVDELTSLEVRLDSLERVVAAAKVPAEVLRVNRPRCHSSCTTCEAVIDEFLQALDSLEDPCG